MVSNLEDFNVPATVRLQSVLHDAQVLRNGALSWLKQHNLVIFSYVLSELCVKVHITV